VNACLTHCFSYSIKEIVTVIEFIYCGIQAKLRILHAMLLREINSPSVYDELLCIRLETAALLRSFHSGRGKLKSKYIQSPKLAYMACRPILNQMFGFCKSERELILNGRPCLNYYDWFLQNLFDVNGNRHIELIMPNFVRKFAEVFEQKYICGKACNKCFKTFATPMNINGFDSHSCLTLTKGKMIGVTDKPFEQHYKFLYDRLNPHQIILLERINENKFNIFLTGYAGTGKSLTLTVAVLQYLIKYGMYTFAVISPTKVAAGLVGGITYHSFLGLIITSKKNAVGKEEILRSKSEIKRDATSHANEMSQKDPKKCLSMKFGLRVIFIDECGMLSHDQILFLDYFLRAVRENSDEKFGGIRVILCGDVLQLPPLVKQKKAEPGVRSERHPVYFFESQSFLKGNFIVIYLKQNHRQAGNTLFSFLLNLMRDGAFQQHHCDHVCDVWGDAVSYECAMKVFIALHQQFDAEIAEYKLEDKANRMDSGNFLGDSKWGKLDTLLFKMNKYWNPTLLPAYYKYMYDLDTNELKPSKMYL
jgi:hypothetical protein